MNTYTARKTLSVVIFAAGILIGCEGQQKPFASVNESFPADDAPRALDGFFNQQTANGARQDGTLYPQHFTDGQLNSLGLRKLAAMTYGEEKSKLAIYLSIPNDAGYAACEASVNAYLTNKGIASDSYAITAGANPNNGTPAAVGLAGLSKQSAAGAAAPAADAGGASSMSK